MSKVVTLSEGASLAIHAMIIIGRSSGTINAQLMAQQMQSSRNHLAKVMQRLVKEGFVKSTRGPSGGFVLNKPANEISLLDIYESIEGPLELSECPLGKKICPIGSCLMEGIIHQATFLIKDYFMQRKLSDFIGHSNILSK
ncbi:MAG: Rrf2 family transcriptional regulator [Lentimicrobium sp.]|jgi:Rrf2 family protein